MSFCYAKNCENNAQNGHNGRSKITLYCVPKDLEIRSIWKNNLGIEEDNDFEFSVCSNHFVEECFDPDDPNHLLILPGAVPTLFCADPDEEIDQEQMEIQAIDTTEHMQGVMENTDIGTVIKLENVQIENNENMIHNQEPHEEVIHQHDLMQMVHNNAMLQQSNQMITGEHSIDGLDNGDQMNTIIIQQEVGEQEVVMEMSQPEGMLDGEMHNGELDDDDIDDKIQDQVLTVKQCRRPLAELLSIYNNKLHIIRLCKKNIKVSRRKIITYANKFKKNELLQKLIRMPLVREELLNDTNSLKLVAENKTYHKKSYEEQQSILNELQNRISRNSKLIGQLHYMESRQMDIIRLLRKKKFSNREVNRLICYQSPVDDEMHNNNIPVHNIEHIKQCHTKYNANSIRYSIQELITTSCQNELTFKTDLEINCMLSISVDNKELMFIRMKRMLAETLKLKRPEVPKHVIKKQSAIHKNRLENQIGGLVADLVSSAFVYKHQLVINGSLFIRIDETETIMLDMDRVISHDHMTSVLRDSSYDALDFQELMLQFNAREPSFQPSYAVAKYTSQGYLNNGTPIIIYQNQSADPEPELNELELKTGEVSTRYMCQFCGMVNPTKNQLVAHVNLMHPNLTNNNARLDKGARKSKCPLCLLELAPNSMKLHLRMHTGEKPYKCDNCGLCFARVDYRARHSCKALSPALDRNKVNYCKCIRNANQYFKLHHTCPNCNLYHDQCWCDICLMKFDTRIDMKKHRLTHPSKFQCTVCDARLTSKQSLKGHMARHNGTQSMYACDICGILMSELANLRRHMRVVHDGERRFQCDVCTKNFTSKMILIEHIRTHTGERPYQCDTCDRRFLAARDLKRHKCLTNRTSFIDKPAIITI